MNWRQRAVEFRGAVELYCHDNKEVSHVA